MRSLLGLKLVVAVGLAVAGCERGGGGGGTRTDNLITYDPIELRKMLQDLAGGHVFVLKRAGTFAEYRDVIKVARAIDPDVIAATPFTFAEIKLRHGDRTVGALLKGLPAERVHRSVEHYVVAGAFVGEDIAEPSLALGNELATLLGVTVGDRVELQVSRDPAIGVERDSELRTARITALLHTGFAEYDFHLAVTTFGAAQGLIGLGDVALGIEIALAHETSAQRIAKDLQAKLGAAQYQATDWCELNRPLLGCSWRADAH